MAQENGIIPRFGVLMEPAHTAVVKAVLRSCYN